LLNAQKVEYLIVGGYAVVFHGYPRFTGVLDIWVNPTKDNSEKVLKVIQEFGFGSLGLGMNDFYNADSIVQLGYSPFRIDIMTSVSGIEFVESYTKRVIKNIDGIDIPVINLSDLIENKKATGRYKDLDDIENLT
jgi:hypothetical protein